MVSRLHAEECESFLELDARVAENSSAIRHLQLRSGCAQALQHAPYYGILATSRRVKNERPRSSQKEAQSC